MSHQVLCFYSAIFIITAIGPSGHRQTSLACGTASIIASKKTKKTKLKTPKQLFQDSWSRRLVGHELDTWMSYHANGAGIMASKLFMRAEQYDRIIIALCGHTATQSCNLVLAFAHYWGIILLNLLMDCSAICSRRRILC